MARNTCIHSNRMDAESALFVIIGLRLLSVVLFLIEQLTVCSQLLLMPTLALASAIARRPEDVAKNASSTGIIVIIKVPFITACIVVAPTLGMCTHLSALPAVLA
jgi:hypothetical protein